MSGQQRTAFKTPLMMAPLEGSEFLPVELDFTTDSVVEIDFFQEQALGVIQFFQSIYVDNFDNPEPLYLTFQGTPVRLPIPANAAGYWPVLIPAGKVVLRAETVAGVVVRLALMNVPTSSFQWGPVSINTNVNVTPGVVKVAAIADRSGTIAVGGTSQVLAAANPARERLIVQNPATNGESLFVNLSDPASAAGDSFEITPGGYWDTFTGPMYTGAVNIVAATGGTPFVAKEM